MLQLNKKSNSNALLIVAVILMTVAIYTRDLFGVSISKYYYVALAIIPALLMNYVSLIYFIFFLFPVVSGLPDNYIFPLLAVILLLKKPNAFSKKAMYCFFVILFLEIIHYPFYDFYIRFPNLIGYLATIFFLCYLSVLKDSEIQNRNSLLYFCIGILVLLVGILYITHVNGGVDMLLESSKRIGETKKLSEAADTAIMLNVNSNGLGFFSLVGMSLLIVLYSLKKLHFVVLAIMGSVYVYVGALSVSRTWLFGIVLMVVLLLVTMRKQQTKNNGLRYFLLMVLIVIGSYAMFQNNLLIDAFNNRMTEDSVYSGNGRVDAMRLYNQALINNPIYFCFGSGAVHYSEVYSDIDIAVHNGIQQILVSYGIIGLFFFLVLAIRTIKMNYQKGFMICALPFITALFFVQSGQLLMPHYNLYFFIVGFIAMRLTKRTTI